MIKSSVAAWNLVLFLDHLIKVGEGEKIGGHNKFEAILQVTSTWVLLLDYERWVFYKFERPSMYT